MLIDDGKCEPFTVTVSVNSENAEGFTKQVQIDPKVFNIAKKNNEDKN